MKISVIGVGYVGLVTSACLAKLGHKVIGADNDEDKIEKLKNSIIPIYEPGLEELIKAGKKNGKLSFTSDIKEAVRNSEIIFICVGTPPRKNGEADLSAVKRVARIVAEEMTSYKLIVGKSTVPVNTGAWIKKTIKLYNKKNIEFDVASNPEFLRGGSAVYDFLNPERIIIGVDSERAKDILMELYKDIQTTKVITNINTAEIIKYASNSFLAMKISFINSLSHICERAGADVARVAEGMGYDKRIGGVLNAGPGYGGYCLPKDTSAFIHMAKKLGYDFHLLKSVEKVNEEQKQFVVKKIVEALEKAGKGKKTCVLQGKQIGILGLSYKPNTDDIRFSSAIDIIRKLLSKGATIKGYDPKALTNAKKKIKKIIPCRNPYEVADKSDALVILTDWEEFKKLDLLKIKKLLKTLIFIDARNLYDPVKMKKLGFIYKGVGR
ncbi:MAG: UDP-glucose/GDP-mannose dehydrogenase family protein [Candidatus Firestonebacteria bacterium]